jgi:hypothetical protein
MPTDPEVLGKLDELLATIRASADPRRATAEWKQAFNQLKKTDAEANHVANVVAMRGVEQLAELIETLRAPDESGLPDPDAPDDATCKAALRAFRKRLKLTRLDDESQINSRNPLTGGQRSEIGMIIPPNEYPQKAWEELARQGKLRHSGKGFYELTDG